ncbi:DUF6527 family protein [Enterobacter roggenkampii]|uniref:Uncharacterized protein n=2 Tax=Enterobacteriaceae TaxID=543 RepID=A0ABD7KP61_9ENTR|nr:DUF6527 family protein [Enterobacter roggenkampii]SAD40653.1 Uncharacterised protein [Enterobacter roggenkampii]
MNFLKKMFSILMYKAEPILPARRLVIVEGDILPEKMPWRKVILTREGGEDWSVGFKCPCGCGSVIELLLLEEAKPHWRCSIDENNIPSLYPSVWLNKGCKSHFWLKHGRIHWV